MGKFGRDTEDHLAALVRDGRLWWGEWRWKSGDVRYILEGIVNKIGNKGFKNGHWISNLNNWVHYGALNWNGKDQWEINLWIKRKRILGWIHVNVHSSGSVKNKWDGWAQQGSLYIGTTDIWAEIRSWELQNI